MRTHRLFAGPQAAAFAAVVAALAAACGGPGSSPGGNAILAATPGLPRYQRAAAIPVPGGLVNAAGGNLLVPRVDLSIDTRLGTRRIGAVYNSRSRAWRWSFDLRYDGDTFVDGSGARYDAAGVGAGEIFPGSVWIRVDATRIRSLGGLVHEFDSDGRLAAIHWASADHPRLEYLAAPIARRMRTHEVRQCRAPGVCASVYTIGYDAWGRVIEIRDRAGRRAEFGYDAYGYLAVARDPLDRARGWPGWRYAYASGGRLVSLTSSEGERVEFEVAWTTRKVKLVRQVGPPDAVHRFSYGSSLPHAGAATDPVHWTLHVDPAGHATTHHFDHLARPRRVSFATGEQIRRSWHGYEMTRLVRPDGTTTEWEHADWDEVVRREPSGNEVHIDFRMQGGENRADPFARPVDRIVDLLGPVETRGYQDGRLVWIENGAGERIVLEYDAENMPGRVTGADGVSLALSDRGEHGHPGRLELGGESEIREYDAVGNLVSRAGTGPLERRPGGELARSYDADRNVTTLLLADAPLEGPATALPLTLEYRSDGRPVRITRPAGGEIEFVYDALGRRVARHERVDGGWRTTHFEHDPLGRQTAEELPNGMRRERSYDPRGRPVRLRSLRNGVVETDARLAYDAGRLAELVDLGAPGPERHAYDAAGRLVEIRFPGGERLLRSHDLRGRRDSEVYLLPGGSVLRSLGFAHDLADRETRLTADGAVLLERRFEDGRLERISLGNGLVRRFGYDPETGRRDAVVAEHPQWGVVEAGVLTLHTTSEPSGVRLVATTTSSGALAADTREEYDLGSIGGGGHRLLAWSDGTAVRELAYDAASNLVASAGGTRHVYNAERNRLLRIEPETGGAPLVAYEADAAGYVTRRGDLQLVWTARGLPAAVGDDHFEWDGLGRPRARSIAGTTRHLAFGGRVETDAAGAPLRLDLGAVCLELDGAGVLYRHRDFRGNVKLVSDDAGAVAAHYHYGPYGVAARLGSADDSASFAGGRRVGSLVLLGGRLLDPSAGRFLAPDPLFQPLSAFTYTQGDPVGWWDPGGLHPESVPLSPQAQVAILQIGAGVTLAAGGMLVVGVHPTPVGVTLGGALLGVGLGLTLDGGFGLVEEVERARQRRGGGRPPAPAPQSGAPGTPLPGGVPAPDPGRLGPGLGRCPACDGIPGVAPNLGGAVPGFGFGGLGF